LSLILKVGPHLAEIAMMNNQTILISSIQLKRCSSYFEALKKKITALAFEYKR
jgi:alanine dehydrogenase